MKIALLQKNLILSFVNRMGPLQDPVTWYGINYTGTQMTQWDFQNKGKSGWTGTSSFVLGVPLRHLRPSLIYSVPCDRILQRAYWKTKCAWNYREHTVSPSKERVNKGTKIMNSLPLSTLAIPMLYLRDFTGKIAAYKSCVTLYC